MEMLSNSQAKIATKSRTENHLPLRGIVEHICTGKTPGHLHKTTCLLCNLCFNILCSMKYLHSRISTTRKLCSSISQRTKPCRFKEKYL